MTVAVLVYAPQPGGAGARRAEATAALIAAERANGADVVEGDAIALGEGALAAETMLAEAERVYAPELWRAGARGEAATAALWHGVALFELGTSEEAQRAASSAAVSAIS